MEKTRSSKVAISYGMFKIDTQISFLNLTSQSTIPTKHSHTFTSFVAITTDDSTLNMTYLPPLSQLFVHSDLST